MELGIAKGLQDAGVHVLLYPDLKRPILMVNSSYELLHAPHVDGNRLWAFNMIETDAVDAEWVTAINRQCERVFVPCPPMIDVYKRSGITIPIDYIPLGVDLFDVLPIEDVSAVDQNSDFRFLTYSYGAKRKGADIAISAFMKAFEGEHRYKLVIKVRDGYDQPWLRDVAQHPQVELVMGRQSEREWLALQRSVHCFVFASRGEGWGFPPRELTLVGIPSIATQWMGMWDVDQWGFPVIYDGMSICEFEDYQANAKHAKWVNPDEAHLIKQMQWIASNYPEAKQRALHGRAYLLQNFTWSQIGKRLADLVDQHG